MEFIKNLFGFGEEPGQEINKGGRPKANLRKLKPYGDHYEDGAVQVSFTLPIPLTDRAPEAAKQYAEKMGLKDIIVAQSEAIEDHFTFFVVYGFCRHVIDYTAIRVHKPKYAERSFDEINEVIKSEIKRKIVVVGATTGSDAHTVGLDAILNMKGYKGDYGLERYPMFETYNLRSQVDNVHLLKEAKEKKADAILVSQLVTQQNQHLKNLADLSKLVKSEGDYNPILIAGGPRMDHESARRLGFQAGFGAGTLPSQVASLIVDEYLRRNH